MLSPKNTILKEVNEIKSLFTSRTFLAICFTAIAAIAPLAGSAIKEKRLTVDNAVQIVLVLTGAGAATVGKASSNNSLVFTPDWMVGLNKSDILPLPVEQGENIEGIINDVGIASIESINEQS